MNVELQCFDKIQKLNFGRWDSASKLQNIGVSTITLKSSLVLELIFTYL